MKDELIKFNEGDRVVHSYTEVEYTVIKDIDGIFVRCHVDSVPCVLQDIMVPGEEYNVCIDQLISAGEHQGNAKRLPLGIEPSKIWKTRRCQDLKCAIDRYLVAGLTFPLEWAEEYNQLKKELK